MQQHNETKRQHYTRGNKELAAKSITTIWTNSPHKGKTKQKKDYVQLWENTRFTTKELDFCPSFPTNTRMPLVNSLTCPRYKPPPRVAAPFASQYHMQSLKLLYPSLLLSIVHLKQVHAASVPSTLWTSGGGKWAVSNTVGPSLASTHYTPVAPSCPQPWQPRMSTDIAKYPLGWGTKPSPVENHCSHIWGKALNAGDSAMNMPHEMSVFKKLTF